MNKKLNTQSPYPPFQRVLLATSPYTHNPGPFERWTRFADPPLGVLSLAGCLSAWHPECRVRVVDSHVEGLTVERFLDVVADERPDLVGLSTSTLTADFNRNLARLIKTRLPGTVVVAGGPHPSALPSDLLDDIDAVVVGEGEVTFSELVGGRQWDEIDGLAWRRDGETVVNKARAFVKNLDDLAFPAYDRVNLSHYRSPYVIRRAPGNFSTYFSSRGCPSACTFCGQMAVWGSRVRFHTVDRVMEDLERLNRDFHVTRLHFYDDTLVFHRRRTVDLCERLIRKNMNLRWTCLARGMDIDDELAELMARAGCAFVEIGVESGDEEIAKRVRKDSSINDVRRAFAACHRHRILVKANFILGLPGETRETLDKSLALARELRPTYANFFHFIPIPGSALYEEYIEQGWLRAVDWSRFTYHHGAVVVLPGATAADLEDAMKRGMRGFYGDPRTLFRFVRLLAQTRDFGTLFRGVMSVANQILVKAPLPKLGAPAPPTQPALDTAN